jgi:hypothetical protein
MRPIAFVVRSSGEAVELGDGRIWAETLVQHGAGDAGTELYTLAGDRSVCRREIELRPDGSLHGAGVISFGDDDAITFRAVGALASTPDPLLRHGTAVLEVTGGRGRLAGASGFITSNFLLSNGGALTDHQVGLIFLRPPA